MGKNKRSDYADPNAVGADNNHYMGIGYHIPKGYTTKEVKALFELWNDKLQKSGHVDLEHYSGFSVGRVSPRIRQNHNIKPEHYGSLYNVQLVDTYLTNYFETNRPKTKKLQSHWAIDKLLLHCFCAGVNLGILERLFTKPTKASVAAFIDAHGIDLQAKVVYNNEGRSKYWIYTRTKTALAYCYAWHLTDVNGELTAEDINFYKLHGVDSGATETIINSVRTAAGLPSIALKWEKKNY